MVKIFQYTVLMIGFLLSAPVADAVEDQIVASVVIDGLNRTEEATVLRELPFDIGSVWQNSYAALAERRLRNLGIFSEAVVLPPDESGEVHLRVKERWTLWVLPQVTRKDSGASSASVVVDEHNLWGLNHHIRLAYKRDTGKNFSTLKGTSYEASYNWRRIADSKLSMVMSGTWGRSLFDAYNNGIHAAQYLQRAKSGSVLFNYALDEVPEEGRNVAFGFSGSNASYRFLSGTPQVDLVGNRIRALLAGVSFRAMDDQITWLSGRAFDYSVSAAHRGLGSTVNSYSHVASIRDDYAFSGENTLNSRLNGALMRGDVQRSGIFDIGNRNGLRGYYPGELQGTHYLYGTFEGRFPIREGSNIQLVAFTDRGKIGGRVGTSVTRGLAVGAGGGFRWTMRWLAKGTLRGDMAYGVATKRWRFYLGTGQAF